MHTAHIARGRASYWPNGNSDCVHYAEHKAVQADMRASAVAAGHALADFDLLIFYVPTGFDQWQGTHCAGVGGWAGVSVIEPNR